MTPRIAIPTPTTSDAEYNRQNWPAYARAIELSGGAPVEVPLTLSPADLRALLDRCHGVCLPGSPADVDPELYGQLREPATAPADPQRDRTDRALLEDALRHAKPVLAICFGLQSLNVWRGGTLLQDLAPLPVNHAAGAAVAVAHSIALAPDSALAALADPAEAAATLLRLPVNSSHHQAIGVPGDGLRVVARSAEDGVIEAVERVHPEPSDPPQLFHVEQSPLFLAVQWHPERSFDLSATSRRLFAKLVADASAQPAKTEG